MKQTAGRWIRHRRPRGGAEDSTSRTGDAANAGSPTATAIPAAPASAAPASGPYESRYEISLGYCVERTIELR